MRVSIIQQAIPTDKLIKTANEYCEKYNDKDVKLRIADFLKFLELTLDDELAALLKKKKRLKRESP